MMKPNTIHRCIPGAVGSRASSVTPYCASTGSPRNIIKDDDDNQDDKDDDDDDDDDGYDDGDDVDDMMLMSWFWR